MELPPDGEESEGEVVDFQPEAEAELVEEAGLLLPWHRFRCALIGNQSLSGSKVNCSRADVHMCRCEIADP